MSRSPSSAGAMKMFSGLTNGLWMLVTIMMGQSTSRERGGTANVLVEHLADRLEVVNDGHGPISALLVVDLANDDGVDLEALLARDRVDPEHGRDLRWRVVRQVFLRELLAFVRDAQAVRAALGATEPLVRRCVQIRVSAACSGGGGDTTRLTPSILDRRVVDPLLLLSRELLVHLCAVKERSSARRSHHLVVAAVAPLDLDVRSLWQRVRPDRRHARRPFCPACRVVNVEACAPPRQWLERDTV